MEGLGLNFRLLIAQIFNFLVLIFVLKKILYKPILKFLDERQKKIEESLLNSEKISKQLTDIEEEKSQILHQAQTEATKLLAEEKKFALEERERIIEEGKKTSAEEVKKGTVLAKEELEKARRQLQQEAISLAEVLAKKIIKSLPPKEKHKLIEEAVS